MVTAVVTHRNQGNSGGRLRILALDPGTVKTGYCQLEGRDVFTDVIDNAVLLETLEQIGTDWADVLVIEWVECYGKPVGQELFETVYWAGRFAQAFPGPVVRISRPQVKQHVCGAKTAKDDGVRLALIDRWGGASALVKSKRCPRACGKGAGGAVIVPTGCAKCGGTGRIGTDGPLAWVTAHGWPALAVAVTYAADPGKWAADRNPVLTPTPQDGSAGTGEGG